MFTKVKKQNVEANYADVHSHILPGMDDGSKNMEQSLEMLRIAVKEGIETIIATPHNMPGKGSPSAKMVEEKVELLRQKAIQEEIPIKILIGTEYFFRNEVLELLETDKVITMNGTNIVLVEFDPYSERKYIVNAVKEILGLGYRPMLAHVERYRSLMEKKYETLTELQTMGALIQINCGSVMGDFGNDTKKHTRALLKKKLVNLIGTDAHSAGKRAPRMQQCARYLYKKYGGEYAKYLLSAREILG